MLGFQKHTGPATWTKPRIPRLRHEVGDDGRAHVVCSCGWDYPHNREAVRNKAADRHTTKRHDGQGIWL